MVWVAFRNILRTKVRSVLTVLGVASSIALFLSLSSISQELKSQMDETIGGSGIDIIIQSRGSVSPVGSRIADDTGLEVGILSGVEAVSPVVVGPLKTPEIPALLLYGVSSMAPYKSLADWLGTGLVEGRLPRPGKKEILLGQVASRQLSKGVGAQILLGERESYTVTGVCWFGIGVLDGGAFLDIIDAQIFLKREGYANLLLVRAENRTEIAGLARRLNHNFPDLRAFPSGSFLKQVHALTMIDGFVAAVSLVALGLSSLIVLNTMLMALSERTREIGILMAVGWSKRKVLLLLLEESALIGLAGGIIGCLLAFPALLALKQMPILKMGWIPSFPPLDLIVTALGLSLGICLASALYPAVFATRLQPACAIRYE